MQGRVEASIVEKYAAGRSLPELAELTDRSFSAVRNILARHGVHRRGAGARLCCVNRVPDDKDALGCPHRGDIDGPARSGAAG